jgi:hypothetical protein
LINFKWLYQFLTNHSLFFLALVPMIYHQSL